MMKKFIVSFLLASCALLVSDISVNAEQQRVPVTADIAEFYTVTLPTGISIGNTKEVQYEVKVSGDLKETTNIVVSPDSTFDLTNGIKTVTASVSQDKTSWTSSEVSADNNSVANGIISAPELKAGTWTGNLNFNIHTTVVDTEAPTGSITIQNSVWREFLNTITFNTTFKNTQDVIIEAQDINSGVKSIEYFVADDQVSEDDLDSLGWQIYTDKFQIEPDANLVIYARLTDNNDNVSIINTDGIIITHDHNFIDDSIECTQVSSGEYSFVQDTNDKWVSNNQGVSGSSATSEWNIVVARDSEYSIKYNVSSELNYDKFTLTLDGTNIANAISGDGTEQTYTSVLSAGCHKLIAQYKKDNSTNRYDDCGYVILPSNDVHRCTSCGLQQQHVYGDLVAIQESTCTATGIARCTCSACGKVKEIIIPENEHTYENGKCTVCGKLLDGLFDANGVQLCSWDESGINATTNYTDRTYKTDESSAYSVITNNYPTAVKAVLPLNQTKLGNYSFYNCSMLTDVVLQNNVVTIGGDAFGLCTNLINVNIPNSVNLIGNYAFSSCKSLVSIDVPESVTKIHSYAFSNCMSLKEFVVPNSIKSMYSGTFSACTSLETVKLPDNVKNIPSETFNSCYKLKGIDIPNTVTTIGASAFKECDSLTSVYIPDTVTSLGKEAFYGCDVLSNVALSNTITCINSKTFYNCKSLKSIEFPSSIVSIADYAFGYSGLQDIVIPDTIQSIGNRAFSNANCRSVMIGAGVTSLSYDAFWFCYNLQSITVHSDNHVYDSRNGCNAVNVTGTDTLMIGCRSTIIPNDIVALGSCAFYYCSFLDTIVIPDSVTNIGASAFAGTSIASIVIPDGVTKIQNKTFDSCADLESVELPSTLTSIDSYAFNYCKKLTLTVPSSVTTIGNFAFCQVPLVHYAGTADGSPWGAIVRDRDIN